LPLESTRQAVGHTAFIAVCFESLGPRSRRRGEASRLEKFGRASDLGPLVASGRRVTLQAGMTDGIAESTSLFVFRRRQIVPIVTDDGSAIPSFNGFSVAVAESE
jgi:hypothetical protein